jgi:Lipopolysaccharide export system permease LptF/LptG
MMPGSMLHRLAALMCCAKTLERVVEPAIADLQKEYASADRASRRITILLVGYCAILKVIAICALSVPSTTPDERQALSRTLAWSFGLIAAISALLTVPPLIGRSMQWYAAVTLVPQAMPLAIPMGIAIGIAVGLSARPGRNIVRVTLLAAVVASALSFGILAWVMPVANQAFKEITIRELAESGYKAGFEPEKGHNEMTLSELRREDASRFSFTFHLRFALAAATLTLASLLLAVPFDHRGLRGLVAFAASFGYLALLSMGETLAVSRMLLPPVAGAWMPNVVLIAVAIAVASSRFNRRSA